MISIQRIDTRNPLYQEERALRNRVLLRPIGLPDYAWEMNDDRSWHFVALDKGNVVGCVVLVPIEARKFQLIQMAVEQELQGKGIGTSLVGALLHFCKTQGATEVICHARENAVPFYAGLGFELYGKAFEEVGIPHRNMRISFKA